MKRKLILIMLCVVLTGCTHFSIVAPDGTKVTGDSIFTDFDKVVGQWPTGGGFEIVGARTQAEAFADIFMAGLKVGLAATP